MLRRIVRSLKKFPLDFGQYELRYTTKGKLIAYGLIGDGPEKIALDVGCRDGYWSRKLIEKGYQVAACDLEPHYPGAARVDLNFGLPYRDNQFDLIWCTEVIEHLRYPVFTVGEFKRVLKPGGVLLMTTPNQGFWVFRFIELLGIQMASIENEEHHFLFSYADMRDLVGSCDCYGYFPYLLLKCRVVTSAPLLSPTIVIRHLNDKRDSDVCLAKFGSRPESASLGEVPAVR
jgi:SAM-dependent methyltransferase